MSAIDYCIKTLIIEQLEKIEDTDLLDLIYRIISAEARQ